MDVLQKIRSLMQQRGWTEYQLAKQSGVPQSTLNSMFRKNNQPTLPTLENLCQAFGISLAEFFAEDQAHRTLTAEQVHLLQQWSQLSAEKREAVLTLIRLLSV